MSGDLFTISCEEADARIDQFLSKRFPEQSRSYFQALINAGHVLVNGRIPKKREKVCVGDQIAVTFAPPPAPDLTPEPIPLNILYEDATLVVVNKPAGLVVHPGAGNWSGTFVNALLHHCKELPGDDPIRPGIVHRLDKETSGVLIAAKTEEARRKLAAQFAEREVEKEYLALSVGDPGEITIRAPLGRHPALRKKRICMEGGKEAITHVYPLDKWEGIALLRIGLETGRTHQIRAHLKSVGCPVLGDPLYGDRGMNQKWKAGRQMLHAHKVAFAHPVSGKPLAFEAPIPRDFAAIASDCRLL